MATTTEESPPSLKSFMDDPIFKMGEPTEPAGKPAPEPVKGKEPDGKTDTAGRPGKPGPAAKPSVAGDAADAGGKAGADKPPAKAAPQPGDPDFDWDKAAVPKNQKDFDAFKAGRLKERTAFETQNKELSTKLSEMEAKLTEATTKAEAMGEISPALTAKIEAYEKQIKDLNDTIIRLNVTEHEDFKRYFGQKTDEAVGRAKDLVGAERAAEIEKILKMPPDIREDRLRNFIVELDDSFTQSRLGSIVEDLKKVEAERQGEIAKAGKIKERIEADETLKRDTDSKTRFETFNKVLATMQDPKAGFGPFQPKPGDAEWNKGVENRVNIVKSVLTGKGPDGKVVPFDTIVRGAFLAGAVPHLLKEFAAAEAKWESDKASLEGQISELKNAQPGGGGSAQLTTLTASEKVTPDMDPMAVAKHFAKDAVRLMGGA
jgi:hypothetical protein